MKTVSVLACVAAVATSFAFSGRGYPTPSFIVTSSIARRTSQRSQTVGSSAGRYSPQVHMSLDDGAAATSPKRFRLVRGIARFLSSPFRRSVGESPEGLAAAGDLVMPEVRRRPLFYPFFAIAQRTRGSAGPCADSFRHISPDTFSWPHLPRQVQDPPLRDWARARRTCSPSPIATTTSCHLCESACRMDRLSRPQPSTTRSRRRPRKSFTATAGAAQPAALPATVPRC